MKKLFYKSLFYTGLTSIMALATTPEVFAVPAKPGLVTMSQPDGTTVEVQIRGDENHHFYLSEDDYLLVDKEGTLYYGNIGADGAPVASHIKAGPASQRTAEAREYLSTVDMTAVGTALQRRSAQPTRRMAQSQQGPRRGPGLFSGTSFPSEGVQKAIVVLVEYTDQTFTVDDPYDYFNRMLNEEGFSSYNGTGSAADYFRLQSNNKFQPEFDLYGPITLANNTQYYGGNDWAGNDQNPQKMVIEACQQLDDEVDFTQYDRDNDGVIDNVFVFYAGRGEASGGASWTVWPHSWEVSSAEYNSYYFDGVKLDRYACSNEWEGSRPDGVGTFVHEFSHVMGLPDLYATSYTSAFTPGSWSAMDYGPYNNNGCTPPNYSIFERYALDWLNPTEISGPYSAKLRNIADTNQGFIIKTPRDREFFLFENRQQEGWDAYIPGHGMLVWHVDYDESVWDRNVVNNSADHQYVDLEEADNTRDEWSRSGDAFPGTAGITSFTDDTRPSMRTWSGQGLELPITNIVETQTGMITFDVAGGRIMVDPPVLGELEDVTPGGFTARWSRSLNSNTFSIYVYTREVAADGRVTVCYHDDYNHRQVGTDTVCVVKGLNPSTEYYCMVRAMDVEGVESMPSNSVSTTTLEPTFEYLAPVALEASAVGDHSFTAAWEPMDEADGYLVSVERRIPMPSNTDLADFTGGVSAMPAGWKTSSKSTYANPALAGEAVPSLRISAADGYVQSAVYDDDITYVSFWMRGASASEENSVYVYLLTEGTWNRVLDVKVSNEAGGQTIVIDEVPEQTRAVRLEYHVEEAKGSVAIDDIFIEWGHNFRYEPVEGHQEEAAGYTTAYLVDGLDSETTYSYVVVATKGDLRSLPSKPVLVVTNEDTGVGSHTAAAPTFRIDGLTLTVAAKGTVTVTDIAGRIVYSGAARRIALPSRGIYIMSADGRVAKILAE